MSVTRGDNDHSTSRPSGFAWARALCLAALGWGPLAEANTSNGYNLPPGVTSLSREIYTLHMEVFWVCVAIAVVVFGVMIYALVKFRHSQGAVADTTLVHSTKVEIIWTIIPVVILVAMAIPAAKVILFMEDTRDSELSIRVTAYQWKWQYQYMNAGEGVNFFSTLARDSNFAPPAALRHRPEQGAELSVGSGQAHGHPERHQSALAADLPGRDSRLVGARFRRQAQRDPGIRE